MSGSAPVVIPEQGVVDVSTLSQLETIPMDLPDPTKQPRYNPSLEGFMSPDASK